MNKNLIRKLAIETDAWCDQNISYIENAEEYNSCWEEKFAKLIVAECADWIRANYDHEDAEGLAFKLGVSYGVHGDYA